MADKDKQKFYWLKLDKDFYQKYKIKSLISEKNGEKNLIIYQQLMCECLNYVDENNNGILRFSKQRAYTINELASVINRKPKELEQALKMLINKELLEVWDDGTICIYDVNVGSITGQTLRKQKGNNVVEITKELPKNYQENAVKNTLEIRDKRLDIYDDSKIKYLKNRWLEAGYTQKEVDSVGREIKYHHLNCDETTFTKIMNIITNNEISNRSAYIQALVKKGEL